MYYDTYLSDGEKVCPYCGKPRKFVSILNGYIKTCGDKTCALKETGASKLKIYGNATYNNSEKASETRINMPNERKNEIEQKRRQTKTKRYGDPVYNNLAKQKQAKQEKYGDANYINISQREETCRKKYGCKNYVETEEFKIKAAESKLIRHGSKTYNNMAKNRKTKYKKYGNEHYNNREKYKKTCIEKYGTINTGGLATSIKTAIETCNVKYGTDYFTQSEHYKSIHKKYEYNGNTYDSPEEITLVKYCEKNNLNYTYQPKKFIYTDSFGNMHKYFVDFMINNKFYEIKCDAFFTTGISYAMESRIIRR